MSAAPQIGLIDCNNFFVSCERLFRPDLRHVPVAVLSSNDGCVVARSQEIKDIGIPMGVPYFQIKDILQKHRAVIFSGNMALYRDMSRRVFDVFRTEVPVVEQYSVDEAFFMIPPDQEPEIFARRLKDTVERFVGVPVSIGVAASKTQAKYASTVAKKTDGVFVCTPQLWSNRVSEIKLESIWGVGAGLAKRFKSYGLVTVSELLSTSPERVQVLFGVVGVRLQAELQGALVSAVTTMRPLQKSLMSSRSFASTTQDLEVIHDALAYHVRHIAADLRSMDAAATVISVSLRTSRHGDFFMRGGSAEASLVAASSDTFALLQIASTLLESLFEANVPYQKVGVVVHNIQPTSASSGCLFSVSDVENPLLMAIDKVNKKSGRELITIGSRLATATWQSKAQKRSPAYTTRWSDIASVSA